MSHRALRVAPLLFLSGMCALVYQNAWQRDFRLVFGASTAASAAVIAVFIGGLGLGGLWFGKRAERHPNPLELYANLELAVGLSAGATPALIWLARRVYLGLGGTLVLGLGLGTVLRLVIASLVLAAPTLLMGGTLPAACRAIETEGDRGRRGVAVLYGVNTLGAVTGCLLAAFVLIEIFGARLTLWMACIVNLIVALVARLVAASLPPEIAEAPPAEERAARAPLRFVLAACAIVGFAFFLMELVWFRMLGPVLGGTVFTFGLVLAIALLGIGLGSLLYSLRGQQIPATVRGFAWTCLLEAVCIAIPWALGDRIPILALAIRPIGAFGFWGHVTGWAAITALVVLPAAIVSGYQFPMLIALIGRGRAQVSNHVAWAYASNTVGAIAGSLAGGFGLLPWLSAQGCWKLVALLLMALGLGAVAISASVEKRFLRLFGPLALAALCFLLLGSTGPTAAWRQSAVGAGRVGLDVLSGPNSIKRFIRARKHDIAWERDGVESSVGMSSQSSLAFVVNGKVDGNSRADAPTQVMAGVLGALLHPNARTALVIGLGTGSTAGWLARMPGIERVDVVELEPAILQVARECSAVNGQVLDNPKVRVIIGDGREVMLASRESYDLIVSEPSNPYRSGIASLFTREYYQAAVGRLAPGGMFLQWVQGYEVDAQTIRTIFGTVSSVFPVVDTWQLRAADMLLISSMQPVVIDAAALRRRIADEPFRRALGVAWKVDSVEGVLGHHVVRPEIATAIARSNGDLLNTDDRTIIEYGFARSLSASVRFDTADLIELARGRGLDRPVVQGEVDWQRVEEERGLLSAVDGSQPQFSPKFDLASAHRSHAVQHWVSGEFEAALRDWRSQEAAPRGPLERLVLGELLADKQDPEAEKLAESLRATTPVESDCILARLRYAQGRREETLDLLQSVFVRHRSDPWAIDAPVYRALKLAEMMAERDPAVASRFFGILKEPFAVRSLDDSRQGVLVALSHHLEPKRRCVEVFDLMGEGVPWEEELLGWRVECYRAANDPRSAHAERELRDYLAHEPVTIGSLVKTP